MVSGLATKCLAEVFSSRVGMGGSLKDGGQGRALPIFRILFGMNDPGVEMFAFFQLEVWRLLAESCSLPACYIALIQQRF